jgi:hypothetical protein
MVSSDLFCFAMKILKELSLNGKPTKQHQNPYCALCKPSSPLTFFLSSNDLGPILIAFSAEWLLPRISHHTPHQPLFTSYLMTSLFFNFAAIQMVFFT